MDSKSLVTRIALLIIGFSLFGVILWGAFVGPQGISGQIIGLVINVVLAISLIMGKSWARWWMAIRCGFGALLSFSAWSQLGEHDFGFFSIIRLWFLFSVVFSAAIAAYLMLSKRVNEHFNPGTGF